MESTSKFKKIFRDAGLLSSISRFNNVYCNLSQTVAEHSFFVVLFAILISDKYFKNTVNFEKVIKISALHDFEEIESGDFPHSAKIKYPEISDVINKFGKDIIVDIFGSDSEYVEFWLASRKCSTIEEKIVSFCDMISVYLYAEKELKMGNYFMENIFNRVSEQILTFCDSNKEFEKVWDEIK